MKLKTRNQKKKSLEPKAGSFPTPKDFIYLFLERGEGKEKESKRNINVWMPLACPKLETWPTT